VVLAGPVARLAPVLAGAALFFTLGVLMRGLPAQGRKLLPRD
jgi:hypothetical protein